MKLIIRFILILFGSSLLYSLKYSFPYFTNMRLEMNGSPFITLPIILTITMAFSFFFVAFSKDNTKKKKNDALKGVGEKWERV